MVPSYDDLESVDLTVERKEFKKVRKGRVYYMIAKKKAKFAKKATDAPAKPKPADTPKPKPEEDDDL